MDFESIIDIRAKKGSIHLFDMFFTCKDGTQRLSQVRRLQYDGKYVVHLCKQDPTDGSFVRLDGSCTNCGTYMPTGLLLACRII